VLTLLAQPVRLKRAQRSRAPEWVESGIKLRWRSRKADSLPPYAKRCKSIPKFPHAP
jgi:hypothetical protein